MKLNSQGNAGTTRSDRPQCQITASCSTSQGFFLCSCSTREEMAPLHADTTICWEQPKLHNKQDNPYSILHPPEVQHVNSSSHQKTLICCCCVCTHRSQYPLPISVSCPSSTTICDTTWEGQMLNLGLSEVQKRTVEE